MAIKTIMWILRYNKVGTLITHHGITTRCHFAYTYCVTKSVIYNTSMQRFMYYKILLLDLSKHTYVGKLYHFNVHKKL